MNQCFYVDCDTHTSLWDIYSEGTPTPLRIACTGHLGQAITLDQLSPLASMGYLIRKKN